MRIEKRKMKELRIDIQSLYCYSCRTYYSSSQDFAIHHHHDDKVRQVSQQPQLKKNNEPATHSQQFVNCLNKENEINVTCHSCSTRFNSLHSFLAHLYTKNAISSFNCKDNNELPPSQTNEHQIHINDSFDVLSPLTTNQIQISQSPSSHPNRNANIMEIKEKKGDEQEHDEEGTQSDLDFFPDSNDHSSESEPESDVELFCTEFKCKFPGCLESFRIKTDLKTHYKTHFSIVIIDNNKEQNDNEHQEQENSSIDTKKNIKPKIKYLCQLCSKTFSSTSILREHHRNFHSGLDKKYKCKVCSKSFSRKGVYKRHMQIHIPPASRPYKCTFLGCTKSYNILSILKKHSRVHTKNKDPATPDLNLTIDQPQHKVKHECDICHKKFVSEKILRDHHRNFHSDNPKDYLCTKCGKSFVLRSVFKRHMHLHLPEEELPFKCSHPGCSKGFGVASFLRKHEQTHLGIPLESKVIHQCSEPDCTASFKTKAGLQHHKEKIHEGVTPVIKCRWSHCAQIFPDKSQLYQHTRASHQEDIEKEKANARFICEYEGCSKRFNRGVDLRCHEKVHGPPTFKCPESECGKMFKLRNNLMTHIRNHSAKNDKQCSECGRCFRSNYQLNCHIKACHLGQKDFKCNVEGCQSAFINSSRLHSHIRSCHSGVNPYKCSFCPKVAFKSKKSLNRHLKKHHEEDEEEEEVNESEGESEEEEQNEEIEETVVLDFDLNNES